MHVTSPKAEVSLSLLSVTGLKAPAEPLKAAVPAYEFVINKL